MNVLLTGGTGFLGKHLLGLLCEDKRITKIFVVTRSRQSHPNPKVVLIRADLGAPLDTEAFEDSVDAVIHLAGSYDFSAKRDEDYLGNVIATQNITYAVTRISQRRGSAIPFHYASTYAVGAGVFSQENPEEFSEEPLTIRPDPAFSYPATKAIAEEIVLKSGLPSAVFRLGILVGDSQTGVIEKIDGPYYLARCYAKLARIGLGPYLNLLPIPACKDALLPFVPVDYAAQVFHASLFAFDGKESEIFGVYNATSISVQRFLTSCFEEFGEKKAWAQPRDPWTLPKLANTRVMTGVSALTQVPQASFAFAARKIRLKNDRFVKKFPHLFIPDFKEYSDTFFNGFRIWEAN